MRIAHRIQLITASAVALLGAVAIVWMGGATARPLAVLEGGPRVALGEASQVEDPQSAQTTRGIRGTRKTDRSPGNSARTFVRGGSRSAGTRPRVRSDDIGLAAIESALYNAEVPVTDSGNNGVRFDASRSIELRAVVESAHATSVRIVGRDPHAPRALWLWRIEAGRAALFARGESLADGSLAFASAIVPRAGLELIAAPAGKQPGGEDASQRLHIAGPPLLAPSAAVVITDAGEWRLRLVPREPLADIVLTDASGRELARLPARGRPDSARRSFEIAWNEFSGASGTMVAHVLPDGRRSEWQSVEPWTFTANLGLKGMMR
jgi:hypothetical protein